MFEVGLSTSREQDRCMVVALLMLLLLVTSVRLLGVVLSLSLPLSMSLTVLSLTLSVGLSLVLVLVGSRVEHMILGGSDGAVSEVVVVCLSGIAEVVQVGCHCLLLVVAVVVVVVGRMDLWCSDKGE
ncbi:hypothetical protein F5H01DRAFT_330831, partial [Linnemannia elongata]